ncbi:MAG TPA: aldo/keto reductase, partial [Desulfosarcina sp.]|nr:aldo/keto reductase [Desulfosarcina sp.]
MIPGCATPAATTAFAAQHPDSQFNLLGATDLSVSAAGFGGYRISAGVAAHARALEKAFTGGVNLVDTSSNYADGGSERLVGEVLANLIQAGRLSRDQVVVISKGGYLQGSNYTLSQERKAAGNPFEDIVEYADGLEHCIHPGFLEDQIGRTLERLGLATLDGYLLHNPEYFLGWAHRQKMAPDRARETYYQRIDLAFRHLETEVAGGRIRFYGVSSNTFAGSPDDPEFTCLHRILEIAESIGRDHHFQVIQLPFNLLEPGAATEPNQPDGRTVLQLARDERLGLLTNRPL